MRCRNPCSPIPAEPDDTLTPTAFGSCTQNVAKRSRIPATGRRVRPTIQHPGIKALATNHSSQARSITIAMIFIARRSLRTGAMAPQICFDNHLAKFVDRSNRLPAELAMRLVGRTDKNIHLRRPVVSRIHPHEHTAIVRQNSALIDSASDPVDRNSDRLERHRGEASNRVRGAGC